MKTLPAFLLLLFVLRAGAQQSPNDRLRMVVAEAKRLYRSEKTSWIGSDVARLKLDSSGKAGAYLSYPEGQFDHFVACRTGTHPVVVGELILDLKADTAMGSFILDERPLTPVSWDIIASGKPLSMRCRTRSSFTASAAPASTSFR